MSLIGLTVVREADFKAAHQRESCQIGQTTQAKQHAAHGVELTGDVSKQPPVHRWGEDGGVTMATVCSQHNH